MNVRLLIQQSYRDAQILAEEGETATSTQLNSGVRLLNRILRRLSTDGFEVPLITEESFTLVNGDSILDLVGWSKLEKVGYFLGDALIDIQLADLNTFYDNAVIRNSSGTPYIAYPKRTPTGINLILFLPPNDDYQIFIRGYKQLPDVVLTDTIDNTSITGFMEDYIGYKLSVDIQIDNQLMTISPWLSLKVKEYEAHFARLKFMRIDRRFDLMGNSEGGSTNSLSGYGTSQGWTY